MTDTLTKGQLQDFPLVDLDDKGKVKGAAACFNKFFGRREGQSLQDFGNEIKDLTELDRAQLFQGIKDGTLNYTA